MQSSSSPIVSLNTHWRAPALQCCEQIAEYWARFVSSPGLSQAVVFSGFGIASREWPWQGAVGGRAVQDKIEHRSTQ